MNSKVPFFAPFCIYRGEPFLIKLRLILFELNVMYAVDDFWIKLKQYADASFSVNKRLFVEPL